MKQLNQEEKEDKNIIQNQLKLLGNKTIRFKIIKKEDNSKIEQPTKIIEKKLNEGRWSYDEQIKFIDALSKYGANWKEINKMISTRSLPQIRSHAQKFYNRLKLCKNEKLGINFTKNEIKNIKDMINQIKLINSNYDVNKILLYLSKNVNIINNIEKQENKTNDKNHNNIINKNNTYEELNKKEKENSANDEIKFFPEILNNNIDLNSISLINSINNSNNLNLLNLNFFNNVIIANNYWKLMNENYLQYLSPIIIQQPFFYNGVGSLNLPIDNNNNISYDINDKI